MKNLKNYNAIRTLLLITIYCLNVQCTRDIADDALLSKNVNTAEIFTDSPIGMGTNFYFPYGKDANNPIGSNVYAWSVDQTVSYKGTSSMRFDVPFASDPNGNYAGGILRIDGAGRDLSGFDAILSVSPYYNKPSQEGIYQHYKAISKASPLPIILYNVPGRTASNITAETTLRLANEFKNIIAIKEASGNIEQCMKIIKYRPDNFLIISGDDNLTLPLIASGADGVISVVANAYPKDFSDMVRFALFHDLKNAQKLHYKLMEITEQLFADGNPGGVKVVLAQKKITGTHVRLPLVEPNDTVKAKLKKIAY